MRAHGRLGWVSALQFLFATTGCVGEASSGRNPDTETLAPDRVDLACTEDRAWPRRVMRLSASELVRSFEALGALDPEELPTALRTSSIPESPNDALAVTRDFHKDADRVATILAERYAPTLPCEPEDFGLDEACTEHFLATEAVRLLRGKRPAETLAGVRSLSVEVAARSGGAVALRYAIRALLLSPSSLYLTEGIDDANGADGATRLSPAELASFLSFRVHGGPPPASLLERLASEGELTEERLRAIAEEELPEASRELTFRFLTSWLGVRGIERLARDLEKHPEADAEFMAQMQEETVSAISSVSAGGEATFETLLTAPFRSALLDDEVSPGFARWERPGVLTLPGIVAISSSGDHTNIPRRGRFLVKSLFCEDLPVPPPGAVEQEPPGTPNETERARFERVGELAGCGSCHGRLHPLAFGLEVYDELGRARETDDHGHPLSPSAIFVTRDGEELAFGSPKELTSRVAKSPVAKSCFILHAFRYVARRPERGAQDGCAVKSMLDDARATNFSLKELSLKGLVTAALAPRGD